MNNRLLLAGVGAIGALILVAVVAAMAAAQQAPVRVVQNGNGTLYLVQGANLWTLVPDHISDADVTALKPSGEVDGTIPNQLSVTLTPSAVALSTPAAPPSPPPPVPTPIDLTGKVASSTPGTPITVGTTYASMVDTATNLKEVYALPLSANVTYQFVFDSTNSYGDSHIHVELLSTASSVAAEGDAGISGGPCSWNGASSCTFIPATSSTYLLQVGASAPGQRYSFTVSQS